MAGNNNGAQENNNEQANANENGGQNERTFTQAEVNAIVGRKSNELKEKYADYEQLKEKAAKYDQQQEASKTELQKVTEAKDALQAEFDKLKAANSAKEIREKVAAEKKIPANLLTADTEEECNAQAEAILKFAGQDGYPDVQDGGEVNHNNAGKTRDQFADWLNKNF